MGDGDVCYLTEAKMSAGWPERDGIRICCVERAATSSAATRLSQEPGWDTPNIARSDPLDKRIYGPWFARVLGQANDGVSGCSCATALV